MESFTFTLIPCDGELKEFTESKGTLENDSLKTSVKRFFEEQEKGISSAAKALIDSSREAEVRAMYEKAGYAVNSETLASAMSAPRTVEITLLTVPRSPDFESVSLYSDPSARSMSRPLNKRATAICHACGHPDTQEIYGDAFLGRCIDDENGDVWERRTLGVAEAHPNAEWVKRAAVANAGRKLSGYSSSDLMAQLQNGGSGDGGGTIGDEGWKQSEAGNPLAYLWKRTSSSEIDIKLPLPEGTRAKDLEVVLSKNKLCVKLKGVGKAPFPGCIGGDGVLCGRIDVEESSWQVEKGLFMASLKLLETSSFAWPRVYDKEL